MPTAIISLEVEAAAASSSARAFNYNKTFINLFKFYFSIDYKYWIYKGDGVVIHHQQFSLVT